MAGWQPVSDIRDQFVAAGLALLERDGLQALSARTLAAEVGTSTMAVYTRFGSMTGVLDAIADEAFTRFAQALTDVAHSDDPVADFFVMGSAYRRFALDSPQRYHLMFGVWSPASVTAQRSDVTATGSASVRGESARSFAALRGAVRRMIDAGRIRDDAAHPAHDTAVAGRLWSISHGTVLLEMAGFFGHEDHGLTQILAPLVVDTLVGLGDDRARVSASLALATDRIGRAT